MNAKRKEQDMKVDHPYFDKPGEPLLHSGGRPPARGGARLDWRQALGVGLIAVGFVSLIIGYAGISGTKETYDQLTYFLSNGIGGAAMIIVGSTVLVIREHVADRLAMRRIDERLTQMDSRLPADTSRVDQSGAHAKAGPNGAVPNPASHQPA